MFKNAVAFAQRLQRSLVVFDLEHTGGTKDNRAVTEFAAQLVTPDGGIQGHSSLVKPPAHTVFEPYVCKLTGIWPRTVENAPTWETLMHHFVLPYKDAIWVGFNSRACDIPMVLTECRRCGVELPTLAQLDLMGLGAVRGTLAERIAALLPGFDTSSAHRAAKDALMTLALLDVQVVDISDEVLQKQGLLPGSPASAQEPRRPKRKKREVATLLSCALEEFLVKPSESRKGKPWSSAESSWVSSAFQAGKPIEAVALAVGRSALAIACALDKVGVLPASLKAHYNLG